MNNKKKIVLGLFIVVAIGVLWVIREAPTWLRGEVAGIRIGADWTDYFFIRGDELDCSTDQSTRRITCETMLEGNLLRAVVSRSSAGAGCEIQYVGEVKGCSAGYTIFNASTSPFGIVVDDNLGFSPQQMASFRSQHPFLYFPEDWWLYAATGVVAIITFLLLLSLWMKTSQKRSGRTILRGLKWVGASVVLFGLLWYGSLWGLIILGYVD